MLSDALRGHLAPGSGERSKNIISFSQQHITPSKARCQALFCTFQKGVGYEYTCCQLSTNVLFFFRWWFGAGTGAARGCGILWLLLREVQRSAAPRSLTTGVRSCNSFFFCRIPVAFASFAGMYKIALFMQESSAHLYRFWGLGQDKSRFLSAFMFRREPGLPVKS